MNTTMLKFQLIDADNFRAQTVKIPMSAKVRNIDLQASPFGMGIMMWAEVENLDYTEDRTFTLIATGDEVPKNGTYMKTMEFPSGTVWHLYELS